MKGFFCNSIIIHTINEGTPVELADFSAGTDGNEVVLSWETATEKNNRGFEVEKSQRSKVKSQKSKVGKHRFC